MGYAVTTVPSSYRAPLTAIELVLGAGQSNAPAGRRTACYVAKKTSAGTAVVGTRYKIDTETQAIQLFGAGSEAHRLCRMHLRANPTGYLYVTAYLASSGGSPVAASEDIVFSGTATGRGLIRILVCNEIVEFSTIQGMTPTEMGDLFDLYLADRTFLPVTSNNAAGTTTVSAKHVGASHNGIHRITILEVEPSTGVSVTVGGVSSEVLTGGADGSTTEQSNFDAALTALNSTNDYYISAGVSVAGLVSSLKTHVVNKNLPINGQRCRAFYPHTGAFAAAAAIANNQNTELMECAWMRNSDHSPDEVIAWYTAVKQLEESKNSAKNFKGYSANGFLSPVRDSASWPKNPEINDSMNEGMAAIVSTDTGVYLAVGVTTSSKDSTGAVNDYRKNLSHRISIMHEVAEQISRNHQIDFADFIQVDDPLLEDGVTVNLAAIQEFEPRTTCPYLFEKWFLQQLGTFFPGKLQNEPQWIANTQCRVDPQNVTRMQVSSAGRTVDPHLQATFNISETTPN